MVRPSEGGFVAIKGSEVMTLKNQGQKAFRGSGLRGAFRQIGKEKDQWSG
jgi:hypothetical protein